MVETLDLDSLAGKKNPNGHNILDTFNDESALSSKVDSSTRPEKRIQAQILNEMMSIDPERALTSMKAWARFVQLTAETRLVSMKNLTLAEYIPMRVIDAGELIWFGTLTFGMALTIPDHEYELCMELARPGYAVLGLTNDLYSWDKEYKDAKKMGQDSVFNAIWVIMREQNCSEEEAKKICGDEIRKYIVEYCRIVDETKQREDLSRDLRAYIEAVMFSITGNLAWSIYCPRYHEV